MRYRLVIFDFDGTLADSFPWFLHILNELSDRYSFRQIADDEIETLRALDARRILDHLDIPLWKLPAIGRHVRQSMAHDIANISLFPGVETLLHDLATRDVKLAIVTSNSVSNVRTILGSRNASLIQHYACGASLFGKRKKIRQVLRQSGVAPEHAISIGDEIRDLQAAHAEHIDFGGVAWGFTPGEAFTPHAPAELFASIEEITEKLCMLTPQPYTP